MLRIKILNLREVPEVQTKPKVLIANHVSYFDIPVLASIEDLVFLGKEEISRWPLVGFAARLLGMIFVRRESLMKRAQSILDISNALEAGESVVVFPEGTTSIAGPLRGRRPFYSGAFRASRIQGVPMEVVHIDYQNVEDCAWLDDDPLLPHLWKHLKRNNSLVVSLRSEWIEKIEKPFEQRHYHGGSRKWLLEGGRSLVSDLLRPPPIEF